VVVVEKDRVESQTNEIAHVKDIRYGSPKRNISPMPMPTTDKTRVCRPTV